MQVPTQRYNRLSASRSHDTLSIHPVRAYSLTVCCKWLKGQIGMGRHVHAGERQQSAGQCARCWVVPCSGTPSKAAGACNAQRRTAHAVLEGPTSQAASTRGCPRRDRTLKRPQLGCMEGQS